MNWNKQSKILVQGITENLGLFYTKKMKSYGNNIVGGISPGRKGQVFDEIPIFDLVEEAIKELGEIQTSIIFLPPYQVLDGALEAIDAGIKEIIIISAGVPPLDMIKLTKKAQLEGTLIVGPGSGGIIVPDTVVLGTIEPKFYTPGNIALLGRSETLNHEIALHLKEVGLGEAIAVSLGNQGIIGSNLDQWLKILDDLENVNGIVITLSRQEAEDLAAKIKHYKKPVIAYIYGVYSHQEKVFADAKTIITNRLSSSEKDNNSRLQPNDVLTKNKISVAYNLQQLAKLVKKQNHSSS